MKKTFGGIPESFASADGRIVLIPVPYDGTSTWVKGSDKGPEAFLHAAENMELYDIETESEVYKKGIHLDHPVKENSSPENMTAEVKRRVEGWLDQEKLVTLFGGEHSISIGAIQAMAQKHPDITILQIDAHADLREEYEGSACNHACAVHWASKNTNLIQVGIRSMDVSEVVFMNKGKTFFAHEMAADQSRTWIDGVTSLIDGPVYITIDLDAFDPSVLPSTGTPEPGGMSWYDVIDLIKSVCHHCEVVGFDIVELCPNDVDKASDFLAAKLYYKILSYIYS